MTTLQIPNSGMRITYPDATLSDEFIKGLKQPLSGRRYFKNTVLNLEGDTLDLPTRITGTVKRWGRTFKINSTLGDVVSQLERIIQNPTTAQKGEAYGIVIANNIKNAVMQKSRVARVLGTSIALAIIAVPVAIVGFAISRIVKHFKKKP